MDVDDRHASTAAPSLPSTSDASALKGGALNALSPTENGGDFSTHDAGNSSHHAADSSSSSHHLSGLSPHDGELSPISISSPLADGEEEEEAKATRGDKRVKIDGRNNDSPKGAPSTRPRNGRGGSREKEEDEEELEDGRENPGDSGIEKDESISPNSADGKGAESTNCFETTSKISLSRFEVNGGPLSDDETPAPSGRVSATSTPIASAVNSH